MTQKSDLAAVVVALSRQFFERVKLARQLLRKLFEMVAFGRVLLWTVALVAPGGFLLVPVLALHGSGPSSATWRERLSSIAERARASVAQLQRYWTKS